GRNGGGGPWPLGCSQPAARSRPAARAGVGLDEGCDMRHSLVQRRLIALVLVLAMAVWFSASAVVPALASQWHLSAGAAAWLTASVQAGVGPRAGVWGPGRAERLAPEFGRPRRTTCAAGFQCHVLACK